MPRSVTVEIARSDDNMVFRLSATEQQQGGSLDFTRFNKDWAGMPELTTPDGVRDYGIALTSALCSHQGVKRELDVFFDGVDQNVASLQFSIGTCDGERYRWETLYAKPEFLAVRGTCNVKRIIPSGMNVMPAPRDYHGPIRMAAFLSPAGVPCQAEFDAITAAVREARARGLDIELAVFAGEQALLKGATAGIADGSLQHVTVRPMPASTEALERLLKDEPVQLLHFFCHGHMQEGIRFLRFASLTDYMENAPNGSVDLSIDRLREIQSLNASVWMTVLNSCSGAQEAPGLYSMAATLARSASPVTIGMAEEIHAEDATMFAKVFYPAALAIINKETAGRQLLERVDIDFGPAVSEARRALYKAGKDGDQAGFRRWCLPVMYQRQAALTVISTLDPSMMERIETVAKFLRMLPGDAPKTLRQEILDVLGKEPAVPPALWPNLFGSYPK